MTTRSGPVTAAAMRAGAAPVLGPFKNRHCTNEEYDAFLRTAGFNQALIYLRNCERRRFVRLWPNVEEWLHAPLTKRMGRLHGQVRRTLSCPAGYHARSYLYYLALRGHLRLDLPWLLAVGDIRAFTVARLLGVDFGIVALADEAARLGLSRAGADVNFRWLLPRIALHRGPRPLAELSDEDVARCLVAVREFAGHPDLATFWGTAERYRVISKRWITGIGQFHSVLYHRGQAAIAPRRDRSPAVTVAPQAGMQALIDRWSERRRGYIRPELGLQRWPRGAELPRTPGACRSSCPELRRRPEEPRPRLDTGDGSRDDVEDGPSIGAEHPALSRQRLGAVFTGCKGLGLAWYPNVAAGAQARTPRRHHAGSSVHPRP